MDEGPDGGPFIASLEGYGSWPVGLISESNERRDHGWQ